MTTEKTTNDRHDTPVVSGRLRSKRRRQRSKADPQVVPDYSKLRPCEATADELALLGASDVRDLVRRINRELMGRGQLPVSEGDFPNTRKRLLKLLDRWRRSIRAQ